MIFRGRATCPEKIIKNLWGMVKIHTGSYSLRTPSGADEVKFLNRRYSPDEKRFADITAPLFPCVFGEFFISLKKGKV